MMEYCTTDHVANCKSESSEGSTSSRPRRDSGFSFQNTSLLTCEQVTYSASPPHSSKNFGEEVNSSSKVEMSVSESHSVPSSTCKHPPHSGVAAETVTVCSAGKPEDAAETSVSSFEPTSMCTNSGDYMCTVPFMTSTVSDASYFGSDFKCEGNGHVDEIQTEVQSGSSALTGKVSGGVGCRDEKHGRRLKIKTDDVRSSEADMNISDTICLRDEDKKEVLTNIGNVEEKNMFRLNGLIVKEPSRKILNGIVVKQEAVGGVPDPHPSEYVHEDSSDIVKSTEAFSDGGKDMFLHSDSLDSIDTYSPKQEPAVPSCSGMTSCRESDSGKCGSDSDDSIKFCDSVNDRKRKRDPVIDEVLNLSDSDSEDSIDYTNLTTEQIRELVEEARRLARLRKVPKSCKCPKKKWSELPIIGPTEPSGNCTIGKGYWQEKKECLKCTTETCRKHRRRSTMMPRRTRQHTMWMRRSTIGRDVPVIELSDEDTPDVENVGSEVSVTSQVTEPKNNECIVLSSSEDENDIVCEAVIKPELKSSVAVEEPTNEPNTVSMPVTSSSNWSSIMGIENWSDTFDLLGYLVGSPPAETVPSTSVDVDESADVPSEQVLCGEQTVKADEAPSPAGGWSCPICLESKDDVPEIMSTTCGHVFCGICIRNAVKMTHKCPTCRKRLTVRQFHRIFL